MAILATNKDTTSYHTAGFSNRMGWGSRPALLLIDVCTAYWTDNSPLDIRSNPEGAASPDSMRRLLAAAREGKVPVVWTKVEYVKKDMSDAGIFYLKAKPLDVWQKGDPRGLAEWMPGMVPEEGEVVVTKRWPSAFFGTGLSSDLTVSKDVRELDVCTSAERVAGTGC